MKSAQHAEPVEDAGVHLSRTVAEDGVDVWGLVKEAGVLDVNSLYSYIMYCDYFSDTCVIARDAGGKAVGFATAFIPSARPDTLFIWQIAVSESQRGKGMAARLLMDLLSREVCRKVRFMEATISPSNVPSQSLFASLANRMDAPLAQMAGYAPELFTSAGTNHEEETRYRIGPIVPISLVN